MKTNFMPNYTVGSDCLDYLSQLEGKSKVGIIVHGEKAYQATKDLIDECVKHTALNLKTSVLYGKEATYENVELLCANEAIIKADYLLAVGGGKCLDVVKIVADKLNKPLYTLPSIASTCAAVSKISIMYHEDGSFKDVYHNKIAPLHCFIIPSIIATAPYIYLWAGIGDTLAKYVECNFSAKNDVLDYQSELGRTISSTCFFPIIKYGKRALESVNKKIVTEELIQVIQAIIISTGSVSLSVNADYNSALAHALFYGLTIIPEIEKNHLHGEVVAYGTLIQLLVDKNMAEFDLAYAFYKDVKLPICLKDLGLSIDDDLSKVYEKTLANAELEHIPFPIDKDMIKSAILQLEALGQKNL